MCAAALTHVGVTTALPDDVRPALPSAADLAAVVRDVRRQSAD